jgi:hypothetical protein
MNVQTVAPFCEGSIRRLAPKVCCLSAVSLLFSPAPQSQSGLGPTWAGGFPSFAQFMHHQLTLERVVVTPSALRQRRRKVVQPAKQS